MMRPPPGLPHVWQHRSDELDAGGQVRGEDGLDLFVGEFLGGAEDAVSGVADRDVDPAEVGDSALHDVSQGGGIADVEHFDSEEVGYFSVRSATESGLRTVPTTWSPRSSSCSVRWRPKPLLTAGDQPDALCHGHCPSAGAISLIALSPLRVRG